MWSWNVLGVALWVAVIVYLVFVIKNIRQRRLKMIITRQRTFEVKNFLISCLEVAALLAAIVFLGWETLFKKPDLTDQAQIASRVTYHALVLEPAATKSYYVKQTEGSYVYYVNGKKYTVPTGMAAVATGSSPAGAASANGVPFSRAALVKKDVQYQKAYVAVYEASYKNTAANGLGMHAGKSAKRYYLIRVPDASFVEK
ncbi:LVIS_2131 family protein [Lactobacillus sp.]|uniref:LVIS_2131 family protein n=1 Tax=Lactobacillus sp. TaxID=1591 RepID=UPI003EF66893